MVGKRTERHLYTLFGVEDNRWVILGTIMNKRGEYKVTRTLYRILDNGTEESK